jgi:thiamine transporter
MVFLSTKGRNIFMPLFKNVSKSLSKSYGKLAKLNLSENLSEILKHPVAILAMLGLLVLLVVLIRSKKIRFTPRVMTQIALVLALSAVLDFFKIYRMPQGGSITFGSMIPLLLISFWYGPQLGLLTGLLFGVLSLILGPYVVHPVQLLFDYPLAYMALGVAGYLSFNKYAATVTAVFLRFICHVISGVAFFASFAPEGQTPLMYSITYNGSFLAIELIICVIIIALLPIDRLRKAVSNV